MRVRHKVPAVFTLSMVDVLCCALGCVVVLWLYNAKENDDARLRSEKLERDAQQEKAKWTQRLATMDAEQARLLAVMDGEQARLLGLLAELADKKAAKDREADALAKSSAELKDRLRKALEAAKGLEAVLRKTEADHKKVLAGVGDERAKKAVELSKKEQALAALLKQADDLKARLEKQDAELARLRRDNAALLAEVKVLRQYKSKEEGRFAGIDLAGRRVIILVDTSGSMNEVREGVPDPKKWEEVCRTVQRLLASLREVRQYQVITFSETAAFPLGGRDQWLDYADKAPAAVYAKLRAIKPHDRTNMHAAMGAAFRYRGKGLDTVYLLSDGLPTVGTKEVEEKLRPQLAKARGDSARAAVLGPDVLRRLRQEWNGPPPAGGRRVSINTIGFFYEDRELGLFLWSLARENEGSFVGMSRP